MALSCIPGEQEKVSSFLILNSFVLITEMIPIIEKSENRSNKVGKTPEFVLFEVTINVYLLSGGFCVFF